MTFQDLEQMGFYYWDTRDQLKNHIYGRSRDLFAEGDARRDAIQTPEDLRRRQREVREFFIRAIGGLPDMNTPLEPNITGVVQGDGFRIEKIIFQSRPQHYVTSNLYVPDGLTEPRGAVLFVCGHDIEGKHANEYQDVCRTLAQAGLIVFAIDPIGQGERFSYFEPTKGEPAIAPCCPDHDHAGEQCRMLGWNLSRFFLHDAMRAIDYLLTRPEVDGSKIGITGNSGGGTQSSMVMLADPRLAAAAPGTFIMNRETYQQTGQAQDAEQIWPGFTAAGYDHEDILLAVAPKPVCVLAVTSDFFPIEGTRRTVERCRRIWEMCDQGETLQLFEDHSVHKYTPAMARTAAAFFSRHLNGREEAPVFKEAKLLPARQLWCTTSGQVRAEFEDARIVHDSIVEELTRIEARSEEQAAQDKDWLREKVYSHRLSCELNPRFYLELEVEGLHVETAFWWSQPGITNAGYLFRSQSQNNQSPARQTLPVTIALWEGGTSALDAHSEWIKSACASGRAVLVLNISGFGFLQPNTINGGDNKKFYGTIHKFADDLVWMDDSLAALRTYDVLRVLELIAEWPGLEAEDVQLYAPDRLGIYARLAASLDPRLGTLEPAASPLSYRELLSQCYYDSDNIKALNIPGIAHREAGLL